MKGRTIREFSCKSDLWPIVDRWAAETGFVLDRNEELRRDYHKGHWLLMAPTHLEIHQERRGRVRLEAWVSADFYMFLSLFSGRKPESRIESGGLTAVIPRKRARAAVNQLLAKFSQSPIT